MILHRDFPAEDLLNSLYHLDMEKWILQSAEALSVKNTSSAASINRKEPAKQKQECGTPGEELVGTGNGRRKSEKRDRKETDGKTVENRKKRIKAKK